METNIYIDTALLTENEVMALNERDSIVNFSYIKSDNFLSPEVVTVLIALAQTFAQNGAYDMLKYVFLRLFSVFSNNEQDKKTKFKFVCDKKKFEFECNFPLSDDQKDKLLQSTVEKLFAD